MSWWLPKKRYCILLLAIWQLTACATGVHLSDLDRLGLDRQAVIHVLHYESALPRLESRAKTAAPTLVAVRRHAAADPAALVAQSLSQLLIKKEKLKNLRIEPRHLPLPVAKNATVHQGKFRNGLILELWTDTWSFVALPADPKTYAVILSVHSRLARADNGRVLWSTGRCRVDGNSGNRDLRLLEKELTTGTKLRKLLAAARDECARQLVRDFGVQ